MSKAQKIRTQWTEQGINPSFYKCDRPKVDLSGCDWILDQFDDHMDVQGPKPPGNIDAIYIRVNTESEQDCYSKLCSLFGHDNSKGFKFDLVFCSWASLHTDPSWKGSMFASLVLRTGSHPYVACSHQASTNHDGDIRLETSALSLSAGDLFVIDPMIPHCANPAFPADDSYLVLLQSAEDFETEDEQMSFYERFPPACRHRYDGFD